MVFKPMSEIANYLRSLVGKQNALAVLAKVVSLDEQNNTCEVEPLNEDANLVDVRLSPVLDIEEGLVVYPKIDSVVVVVLLDEATAYVGLVSEILKVKLKIGDTKLELKEGKLQVDINAEDGIVFNGGGLGGMVIVGNLVQAFNGLANVVNQLINNFNTHTHIVTVSPPPALTGTSQITLKQQLETAQITNVNTFQNNKIKH